MTKHREKHRFHITLTCYTCGYSIDSVGYITCMYVNDDDPWRYRRIGCKKCKNRNDYAVLEIHCYPGKIDVWNPEKHTFSNVRATIKNVDTL